MFGIDKVIYLLLMDYFSKQPEIITVTIYGSRALGTEKTGSDIDLSIVTDQEEDISGKVFTDLDELPTPYLFDVIDYQKITHLPLKAHIDHYGKVLYQRTN